MKLSWLLLPTALVAIGCGSDGPVEAADSVKPPDLGIAPGNEASLMPLKVGNEWTYTYEQSIVLPNQPPKSVALEMNWKVTQSKKTAKGTVSTIEIYENKRLLDRQDWLANDKGLYQVTGSLANVPYDPPQPILVFGGKTGDRVEWKGSGLTPAGGRGKFHATYENAGPEEVDMATERAVALSIRSASEFTEKGTSGRSVSVSWFKPGVGIVRYHSEAILGRAGTSTTLRLKSSNLK